MKNTAHRLALAGAWFQLVVPVVYANALIAISRVVDGMNFGDVKDTHAVIAQVNRVTSEFGSVADGIRVGLSVAMAGLLLFIIALTRFQYRRRWAFWFACLYGGILLFVLPATIPFGIFLLVYAFKKRDEFPGRNVKQVVLEPV